MNISENIACWGSKAVANSEELSFDYCFNYFQSFRKSNSTSMIAISSQIEMSCLQLGFYLASWGMYRGSTELSRRNVKQLEPVVELIAKTDSQMWDIDVCTYSKQSIEMILKFWEDVGNACTGVPMSDTLATKIMLGVFGCVPAFDSVFKQGCKEIGICQTLGEKSLGEIAEFYRRNSSIFDKHRIYTRNFIDDQLTDRLYTQGKLVDMAIWEEGKKVGRPMSTA